MLRRAVTASFIVVSFAALSLAQTKPNYSGTWKLNIAKSDFGVMPAPESQTSVVTHADPALKINVRGVGQQGKMEYTADLTTDGKESAIKMGPRDVKVAATWEGSNVVLNSKLTFNDQDVAIKSVWTLSEDGKAMTQSAHFTTGMGEFDQRLVFDKQDSAEASVAPAAASVGGHPNFSGVWKLNVAKSDFGVIPPPDSRIETIEHNDPALKLSVDENGPQGPRKYTINASNDGKEVVNDLGGLEAKITTNWEGPALVASIKLKFQDADIVIKQMSTLSADGKVLTNKNHITSQMGEMDQTEVYEKQ